MSESERAAMARRMHWNVPSSMSDEEAIPLMEKLEKQKPQWVHTKDLPEDQPIVKRRD